MYVSMNKNGWNKLSDGFERAYDVDHVILAVCDEWFSPDVVFSTIEHGTAIYIRTR